MAEELPSRRTLFLRATLFAFACWVNASPAAAATYGWRRDGTGQFPGATPPTAWPSGTRVAWSVPLDKSNASPVLAGHTLFVCEEPTTLVAVDARSGKVLWRRPLFYADTLTGAEAQQARDQQKKGDAAATELLSAGETLSRIKREARAGPSTERDQRIAALQAHIAELQKTVSDSARLRTPPTGDLIGYSSGTPVTDGKAVYVVFANGVAAAFTLDGRRLWVRWLGAPAHPMNGFDQGHASSPLLSEGRLIIGLGKLRALDARDGHDLWQAEEYRDYGTPALTRIDGVEIVVTPGGSIVRSADGQVLSRGLSALRYTGPVVSDGVAYFAGSWNPPPPMGDSVEARARAVRLTSALLTGGAPQVLFDVKLPEVRYYASPVVQNGQLYTVSERGRLTVLQGQTGATVFDQVLWATGSNDQYLTFFPSLVSTGDVLFVSGTVDQFATTWTIQPGTPPKILARSMLDGFQATLILDGKRLYVRGLKALQALEAAGSGKKAK